MHRQNLRLTLIVLLTAVLMPFSAKLTAPFQVSQVLAQTTDARKAEADRLFQQGRQQKRTSQFEAALKSFQQALIIYREIKDRQGEGWALGNLGTAYRNLGNYAKAIEYAQQWLAIAREIKDRQSEGLALGNLGIAYGSLGNYAKAIEYEQQLLAIAREIKDRRSEGAALGNLANVYRNLGNYAKAIEYAQQQLAIAREIKDRDSEGLALNNLGLALFKSGKLSLAESTLIEGIKVRESLRGGLDDIKKVSISDTQGNTYRTLQKVLIAENKTDAALEIAERGRARAFVELLNKRLSPNNSVANKQFNPSIAEIKQTEAKAIATLFNTKAIIGNEATKTAIVQKMTKARIVHLATHGLLDDYKQLGVPGAIALAPDPQKTNEEGNGLLTAYEILDLKLNAELVVLSACDTGRGRITGDGVIGLSRSLITAGVSSVMVSLWKVPDEATASLMSEFYKNIQHKTDKATALRQAMLTTMKKEPEPVNWAAFTLIGESE
jgi:CHAT domain-containing protein